ncbi:MAG: hypothetical protein ACPL1B_09975 [Thermoprotei archaeon]
MKKKVLLASAILASSIGLISCGGGGGGDSAPATTSAPPPPPPPPPPPAEVGRVLVLAQTGITKDSSTYAVYEGSIKSDDNVFWSPVNTSGVTLPSYLEQVHEFDNKNVIIRDINNNLYCYSDKDKKLIKLEKITASTTYAGLPNFFITDAEDGNTTNVVLSNCTVAKTDNGVVSGKFIYGGKDYVLLDNGFVVKADGTPITKDTANNDIDTGLTVLNRVENENTLVVTSTNNNIYLVKDNGTVVNVGTAGSDATIQNAQVVRVGADYYVAAFDSQNNKIYYAKVDSNNKVHTVLDNSSFSGSVYALDGQGDLYYSDGSDTYQVSLNTNSSFQTKYTGVKASKIIPLEKAALANYDNGTPDDNRDDAYYLLKPSQAAVSLSKLPQSIVNAFNTCSTAYTTAPSPITYTIKYASLKTEPIMGKGTNTLMCTDSGDFAYLKYNQTNDSFNGDKLQKTSTNNIYAGATQNGMIFVNSGGDNVSICKTDGCTDKPLSVDPNRKMNVKPNNAIKTAEKVLTKADTIYYLMKAAYYDTEVSPYPYIVDLGVLGKDEPIILNPLSTEFNLAKTSGNISLDLYKVATVYQPYNSQCNTGYDNIYYKDINTGKTSKIDRSSIGKNTCFINVLQVR